MLTSAEIRQQFLAFFEGKGHTIVDSSPVVPHDDPTLMFTNAGMNQFKDVFLGTGRRNYVRATNTQKCIRAGGKHNDLDDVGQDTYHHTFFEMLGNWSFGDYFKREAITWAWELLTEVWGIDKTRLYATVFEGNEADGLPPDTEADELWKEVTDIDPSHVTRWGKKDNFWEMGDTGPCGPCSEIHIDLTPDKSGASLVNAGDPRVIELWNLVFIQFNRRFTEEGKTLVAQSQSARTTVEQNKLYNDALEHREFIPLPAKHIDTGMGFERLCAVLQGMQAGEPGSKTNYDTDVFGSLFEAIRKRTGAPKYMGTLPGVEEGIKGREEGTKGRRDQGTKGREKGSTGSRNQGTKRTESPPSIPQSLSPSDPQVLIDVTYRVIADHVRCLTFALTDGAIPGNEGRGYVLRNILRRAYRRGSDYLDMHEPFMCDLVAPLIDHMAGAFPELRTAHGGKNVEHVTELIREEEALFLKTLDRAIHVFEVAARDALGHAIAADLGTKYTLSSGHSVGVHAPPIRRWTLHFEKGPSYKNVGRITREEIRKHTNRTPVITGTAAFKLYATYGCSIDLTEQMAEERGLAVDVGEYERLMEEARERARSSMVHTHSLIDEQLFGEETPFVGHDELELDTVVERIFTGENYQVCTSKLENGQHGAILLWETPFYAEQGGQVGDKGILRGIQDDWEFEVSDTQKSGRAYVHYGECVRGTIYARIPGPGGHTTGRLEPDPDRRTGKARAIVARRVRERTMQNHTSTHVLNWALREVLGEHVQQKGSLVDPEKTRFDFSNRSPMTDEQIVEVEQLCREQIDADYPVYTKEVDQAEARKINTLRAVFGEKYPDRVRVVSIGVPITEQDAKEPGRSDWLLKSPDNKKWMRYSVEFCGGTHVLETEEYRGTGQIERFVLISEEGVAKGVRRVVGISGDAAMAAAALGNALIGLMTDRLENPGDDLVEWLPKFQKDFDEMVLPVVKRHQIRDALVELQKIVKQRGKKQDAAAGGAVMDVVATLLESAEEVGGVTIVVGEVPQAPADQVRGAIDWVRQKCDASAVLLATAGDGRVTLLAGMSKKAVERGLKAGDLIRAIAPIVGGKGGGKPDLAQGGGKDPSKIPDAIERARSWLKSNLGRA